MMGMIGRHKAFCGIPVRYLLGEAKRVAELALTAGLDGMSRTDRSQLK